MIDSILTALALVAAIAFGAAMAAVLTGIAIQVWIMVLEDLPSFRRKQRSNG